MLTTHNLTKQYSNATILDGINLDVQKGEIVSILGKSGSGKTTLLNLISGIETPDEGEIFLNGENITGQTGKMGYMFQKNLLMPWRTALDNIALPLIIKGKSKKEARKIASEYLPIFGLSGIEKKYPFQLSGGMNKRLSLLRTFLFSQDLILLDEPFAGLDAITKKQIHRWLLEIMTQEGSTLILVTHDIEEAIFLSDKIIVISPSPAKIINTYTIDLPRKNRDAFMHKKEATDLRIAIEMALEI